MTVEENDEYLIEEDGELKWMPVQLDPRVELDDSSGLYRTVIQVEVLTNGCPPLGLKQILYLMVEGLASVQHEISCQQQVTPAQMSLFLHRHGKSLKDLAPEYPKDLKG